ncbi:MAG: ATP synthase F1 subunit delta [Clostridia bacterium]|nr:ATP synthase F1 subunit delta [Clostridia bacterium]
MTELTKEYAEALFSLGREKGMADSYAESLDTVLGHFQAEPEYVELLSSPGLSGKARAGLFSAAFEGRIEEDVLSLVCLLCERGHIKGYADCVSEYRTLLDVSHMVSTARVISAIPLTDDQLDRIREKLEAQSGFSVTVINETDPKLIGGVVIEMDDKVIDGSIKRRLQEVKEVISK